MAVRSAGDVVEVEGAAFLGEPGVQHHLQQHVAQLGLQFGVAGAGLDGLRDLVGLLQEVLHEGLVGEGTHPGAVLAQGRNRPHQLPDWRCGYTSQPLDGWMCPR